jgi:putative transposase
MSAIERKLALERFRLLEPHLQNGRELRSVSEGSGVTFRTLQRWVANYKRQGLAGLVRKERTDVGERRTVSPRLREAIEGLALEKPPLPLSSVHRQAKQFAQMIGEPSPSYWIVRVTSCAVCRMTSEFSHSMAPAGSESYMNWFIVARHPDPTRFWQADHTQLDIILLREDGTAGRPWLTAVIDDYSRSIAGYFLGFDPPSSLRTSLAMRQAIWRKADSHWQVGGIPDVLYVDNGTDFVSKHLEQVAVDLKMRLVFSTPGKPQGRGKIERFFRTVNEMFLCDLEGYTRRGRRKPTMTIDQLEQQFRAFLIEVYQRTPVAESELSPSAKWEEGGFLPRIPASLEQLDLLLIEEIRPRKVRRDGIHFQGFRYISLTLAAYVGEDVTVRFDPRDMAEIRVFFKDRFLCRAISAEIAGETVALRDIVRVRNSRRRELRNILDSRQKTVDALLQLKKGQSFERTRISEPAATAPATRIKRYRNE